MIIILSEKEQAPQDLLYSAETVFRILPGKVEVVKSRSGKNRTVEIADDNFWEDFPELLFQENPDVIG